MSALTILFVCTGNICRSPMAEGVARFMIEERYPMGRTRIDVSSCGVAAVDGNPPTAEAVAAVRGMGIDISGHRAMTIDHATVAAADLVLVMEQKHRVAVEALARKSLTGVFLLLEAGRAGNALIRRGEAGAMAGMTRSAWLSRLAGEIERGIEMEGSGGEVPDPLGRGHGEYERVASLLAGAIEDILGAFLGVGGQAGGFERA